jgi:hypothetical protein
MTILVRNVVGHEMMSQLNTVLEVISAGCYLVWIFFLTRAGESRITMMWHNWSPDDEQRLIDQLNSINATLLRAARK